jgi:hypothetical protein
MKFDNLKFEDLDPKHSLGGQVGTYVTIDNVRYEVIAPNIDKLKEKIEKLKSEITSKKRNEVIDNILNDKYEHE